MNINKISGIKKAVGEYKEANGHGAYSAWYGYLMLDKGTGEIWTDTFYNLGHNEWKEYHDKNIINLSAIIHEHDETVTMKTVEEYAEKYVI